MTFEQMIQPVWRTTTVYGETFTMVRDKKGEASAPFLYTPLQILSVTNATQTETYEQGVDYIIEDNCIKLTENSRIFSFTEQEVYYDTEHVEGKHFYYPKGNLLYGVLDFFHQRQIAVTYTCQAGGWQGHVPVLAADKLPRTFAKLQNKQPLTVVIFGDSISMGADSSKVFNKPPYQPAYAELFIEGLKRHFNTDITMHNPSVGGMDAVWARNNAQELVSVHNPDLVVIAFGMNDGGKTPQAFNDCISDIMQKVRETNPNAEFLLVGTSTPNPLLTDPRSHFNNGQELFTDALFSLAEKEENAVGVAVANIRDMQKFLHTKKRFIDTTGNHVNHPNDFFYRLYAQYLCGMFYS